MKTSDVFWNAAQEIQDDQVACYEAIGRVVGNEDNELREWHFFSDLFKPDWHLFWWWSDPVNESNDEARRLALLFAYYIAKDEEETNEN